MNTRALPYNAELLLLVDKLHITYEIYCYLNFNIKEENMTDISPIWILFGGKKFI